jgi:hypothetical protein
VLGDRLAPAQGLAAVQEHGFLGDEADERRVIAIGHRFREGDFGVRDLLAQRVQVRDA